MLSEIKVLKGEGDLQFPPKTVKIQKVAVGCSGGLDSTVLFHLLWSFFKGKKKSQLAIIHINFGLRGEESQKDEVFLKRLSQQLGVEIFLHRAPPGAAPKAGIQAWARQLRYSTFKEYIQQGWVIALGHHRDDVAENALLRLARGGAPSGLAGMQVWHSQFWRPLLAWSRDAVEAYCARHKLQHREDSSNATMKYARNVVRHKVLPELESLFPGAARRIAETAYQVADLADFTRAAFMEEALQHHPPALSVESLRTARKGTAYEAIVSLIRLSVGPSVSVGGGLLRLAYRKLEEASVDKRFRWSSELGPNVYLEMNHRFVSCSVDKSTPKEFA